MGRKSKYPAEVRERAVRLVLEQQSAHGSQWAAITSIAGKIGSTAETLRKWVRQAERRWSAWPDEQRARAVQGAGAREPGAEACERDSSQGVSVFRTGGARPPTEVMVGFIDERRGVYGVEPICEVLPIAPSTYYEHAARRANPDLRPARAKRDELLRLEIERVFKENFAV